MKINEITKIFFPLAASKTQETSRRIPLLQFSWPTSRGEGRNWTGTWPHCHKMSHISPKHNQSMSSAYSLFSVGSGLDCVLGTSRSGKSRFMLRNQELWQGLSSNYLSYNILCNALCNFMHSAGKFSWLPGTASQRNSLKYALRRQSSCSISTNSGKTLFDHPHGV